MHPWSLVPELDDVVSGGNYHGAQHIVGADVFGWLPVDVGEPIGLIMNFAKYGQLFAVAVALRPVYSFLPYSRNAGCTDYHKSYKPS